MHLDGLETILMGLRPHSLFSRLKRLSFCFDQEYDPPILNCHMNRTVTVDISSADSAWNYVHVETDKGKPICRSDFNKEGLSFDIDKECQIEVTRESRSSFLFHCSQSSVLVKSGSVALFIWRLFTRSDTFRVKHKV